MASFQDEAKITKLVELGFGREAVIQALKLFNGNEEQAAGFLFGGWQSAHPTSFIKNYEANWIFTGKNAH